MANNISVKDGGSNTVIVKSTDNAGVHTPHHNVDTLPALVAGSAVIGKVGIDQTTPGTTNLVALAANQSVNVAQMNGVAVSMGAGVAGTGTPRVVLATDGQGQVADNAAFTDGTTRLGMSGYIYDETAGTALTENDAGAARIDSKRAQVMVIEDVTTRGTTNRLAVNTSLAASVTPVPHTTGGGALVKLRSAATTNATVVKASAGKLLGWRFQNRGTVEQYVKIYNKATTPAPATDTGAGTLLDVIQLLPGQVIQEQFPYGLDCAAGIGYAIVGGQTDADATSATADAIIGRLDYK